MLRTWRTPQLPAVFKYTLDDGLPILVRPIRVDDAPRIQQGFQRLSQLARRRRFPNGDPDQLSEVQLAKLVHIDQINHAAWGAANIEKPDEPGIGLARYVRLNGEPQAADVAITILDEYQGRGAGFVLQACLHLTAWRNGIRTFYYDVASDNDRVIRHLKLLGATHAGRADNIDRLELPVYHRARDVPDRNEIGRRFADVFVRLQHSEALAA
ncbi:GNAT family N-acetyltransferase [Solimonas marina]|uniref:GNAT family N-acetyltransferase n=1 Tax=Solimonas marina TaxID=2714601 RepID=A0A969WDI3_9GAMM|nr:GNAT family N-acetyltransferase [Solimonas marina]NKF24554.1 GNAT family N-acetyltransferase [Solimonas marina]